MATTTTTPTPPIPVECPRCRKTLYPLRTLRPKYRMTARAMAVSLASGTIATAVFVGGGLTVYTAVRATQWYPFSRLLGLAMLVPAVLAGVPLAWVASRFPRVVRLRCRHCGWAERFYKQRPTAGVDARPTRSHMRSPLGKEVFRHFAGEMAARVPRFERLKHVPGVDPTWAWDVTAALRFLVTVQLLRDYDMFVVEVGWTDDRRRQRRVGSRYKPLDLTAAWDGTRLGRMSGDEDDKDWVIGPNPTLDEREARLEAFDRGEVESASFPDPPVNELIPRVRPLVVNAVDQIVGQALPLFERVMRAKGVTPVSLDASRQQKGSVRRRTVRGRPPA